MLMDDFGLKGTLRVLLKLIDQDSKVTDFLKTRGSGQGELYTVLRNPQEMGLVYEYRDRFNSRYFKLTASNVESQNQSKESGRD